MNWEENFNTELTPEEEAQFQAWRKWQRPEQRSSYDYDLRYYWKNLEDKTPKVAGYNVVDAKTAGLDDWFKKNTNTTAMAWGAGLNGSDPESERVIVANPYTKLNHDAVRQVALNEAIRHKMNEDGFNPSFVVTPEQKGWSKDKGAYATNEPMLKETIIARAATGDSVPKLTQDQEHEAAKYRDWIAEQEAMHLDDSGKKPNHPSFSKFSIYNGADRPDGGKYIGGDWEEVGDGKFKYTASKEMIDAGTHTREGLQQYFSAREPNTTLILPPQSKITMPADQAIEEGLQQAEKNTQ
jgi:hypothetical protein